MKPNDTADKATKPRAKPLPAGVGMALLAAGLFGASTPFAKLLLGEVAPVLLAGLLYFGSGIGGFVQRSGCDLEKR